jgi:hypothetical protein
MYEALLDVDEPTVEEYMAQGFTREEAILIIFEERFGKVSILKTSKITPAMPTLHKLESTVVSSGLVVEADEPEIETLMTRGFTREQAIKYLFENRQKEAERRIEEQKSLQLAARMAMSGTNTTTPNNNNINLVQESFYGRQQQQQQLRRNQSTTTLRREYSQQLQQQQSQQLLLSTNNNNNNNNNNNIAYNQSQDLLYEDDFLQQQQSFELEQQPHEEEEEEDLELIQLLRSGYTRQKALEVLRQKPSLVTTHSRSNSMSIQQSSQQAPPRLQSQQVIYIYIYYNI